MKKPPMNGAKIQRGFLPRVHHSKVSAFAGKANDLDALRGAVVDAAGVSVGLWLSYLFVLFYLAIAVGSVTHRDLFLEKAVKLPFLNVELPLVAFFVVGPGLFLIVHAYVLLHFTLLADKTGAFHEQLTRQIGDPRTRSSLRRQLPSNIFVQYLAGPPQVRAGLVGFLLRSIAEISLVYLPIALLVLFQLQFLAYHSETITLWHRGALVIELIFVWALWPSIARGEISRVGALTLRSRRVVASIAGTLLILTFSVGIATFPGEWLNENTPSFRLIPTHVPWLAASTSTPSDLPPPPDIGLIEEELDAPTSYFASIWNPIQRRLNLMDRRSLHDLLIAGEVDAVTRRPVSLWSNRLVLPQLDLASGESLSLRGRNLQRAVLFAAQIPKADFTGARMQEVLLDGADLRGARFGCGKGNLLAIGGFFYSSSLPDVKDRFDGEDCTQLQNASLRNARLQDAVLDGAELQGADLHGALLHGASMTAARLQGSSLMNAELHGAILDKANLMGADLSHAELYAASLIITVLDGAKLYLTQLHGARFVQTDLSGTAMFAPYTWRATVLPRRSDATLVLAPNAKPEYESKLGEDCKEKVPVTGKSYTSNGCVWSKKRFELVKQTIVEGIPDTERRKRVIDRIEVLNPAAPAVPGHNAESSDVWQRLTSTSPSRAESIGVRAKLLASAACETRGSYLIRALLAKRFDVELRQQMAQNIVTERDCRGTSGLSQPERRWLESYATD
ncbi:pentapeptide repeat-containing protein [Bradyrhizobium diazoefficiens]|nr:pentapeptide repeat-containing protein [Bradyrhizobium diazoefficiens]MBR0813475.1 pentapeptide repeat-containing protein [Bradyrhizobium diazoefficiens]